jgi:hypothetical protein
MWESKAWFVLERLISLITICVLVFAIWKTLIQNEASQVERQRHINATLEAIRERMTPESWQQIEKSLQRNR